MTASQLFTLLILLGAIPELSGQAGSASLPSGRQTYDETLAQYLSDKDQTKARLGYLTALKQDPMLVEPRLKLVAIAVAQREWKEAASLLDGVLQIGTTPDKTIAIRSELENLSYLQRFGSPAVFSTLDPSVQTPSVITKTDPQYTRDARKTRVNGNVVVWVEVDESGVPANLQIVEGLGHGLNEKAIEAVSKWRFKPATKDGRVVLCGAVVTVNFRIGI